MGVACQNSLTVNHQIRCNTIAKNPRIKDLMKTEKGKKIPKSERESKNKTDIKRVLVIDLITLLNESRQINFCFPFVKNAAYKNREKNLWVFILGELVKHFKKA